MTCCARIWHFVFVGHRGRYEPKRMRSNPDIRNGGLDFRHVARNTTATRRPFLVMSMLFDGGGAWAIQRKGTVAIHTNRVPRFSQLSVIVCTVHIVTTKTGYAATVHDALYKIIPLHTVLVRGAVWEMSESRFAQVVCFQLPKITQV
jgi:hypothetical protein